jgi:hypothetical protein
MKIILETISVHYVFIVIIARLIFKNKWEHTDVSLGNCIEEMYQMQYFICSHS